MFLEDMGRLQAQAQQMKLAALGRLTANIAHEIRNPLSAISHAAELLREEKRGRHAAAADPHHPRQRRSVWTAWCATCWSSAAATASSPSRSRCSHFLATFLDEFCMHEKVAPRAVRSRGRRWCDAGFRPRPLQPGAVEPARQRRALLQRRCRRRYGSRAEVSAAANRCELHIIDDGRGIDEKLRGQVFEPFFTTHSKGTGLGLYIARELCEANGGDSDLCGTTRRAHTSASQASTGNGNSKRHGAAAPS
ncbi:MAG: ATP-binding protein [Comamonadaceae bacterium]|nr:ATP-binding protein [Comamonadaceae bacterium]